MSRAAHRSSVLTSSLSEKITQAPECLVYTAQAICQKKDLDITAFCHVRTALEIAYVAVDALGDRVHLRQVREHGAVNLAELLDHLPRGATHATLASGGTARAVQREVLETQAISAKLDASQATGGLLVLVQPCHPSARSRGPPTS